MGQDLQMNFELRESKQVPKWAEGYVMWLELQWHNGLMYLNYFWIFNNVQYWRFFMLKIFRIKWNTKGEWPCWIYTPKSRIICCRKDNSYKCFVMWQFAEKRIWHHTPKMELGIPWDIPQILSHLSYLNETYSPSNTHSYLYFLDLNELSFLTQFGPLVMIIDWKGYLHYTIHGDTCSWK